jgi:hypothetical protein
MMVHYYYIDHSKQPSSGQSESSGEGNKSQPLPFNSSSEVLNGRFFLFGQSIWIICQLLGKIIFFSIKRNFFFVVYS